MGTEDQKRSEEDRSRREVIAYRWDGPLGMKWIHPAEVTIILAAPAEQNAEARRGDVELAWLTEQAELVLSLAKQKRDEAAGEEWIADTQVRRHGCPAQDLAAAIAQAVERYPSSRLVRNQVGNLSVLVDEVQVGALDLTFGRFMDWSEDESDTPEGWT